MKFILVKTTSDGIGEIVLNLDSIDSITKEKTYDEQGRFNYVEIPNKFNYFVHLKNGVELKISYEEYEKIKKEIL